MSDFKMKSSQITNNVGQAGEPLQIKQEGEKKETFYDLVRRYLSLEKEIESITKRLKELERSFPPQPAEFQSIREAEQFSKEVEKIKSEIAEKRRIRFEKNHEYTKLKDKILVRIPLTGSWIRVGKYAVGKYVDVWGGKHHELLIVNWDERYKYSLEDRTYYP